MTLIEIITTGLTQLVEDIIRASQEAGQEASGGTYQFLRDEMVVQEDGQAVIGEIWAPVYFYTLIRGRGPGGTPTNMLDIIIEWAGYKGITFSDPDEMLRFANAVKWKIIREGSELYRNHLYVDIVDTAVRNFEEYMDTQLANWFTLVTDAAWGADNFEGHGYII